MLRLYKSKKYNAEKNALIRYCRSVTEKYRNQGLRMTLRQLYYQLVSAGIIPNQEKSYKNLGNLVSDARLGGLLDWDIIEDRARQAKAPPEFGSLSDLIEAAISSYRLPRMANQDNYVELWVEKDALAGVLAPIARKYHAVLMVNRGYSSQSAMHESAIRIDRACRNDKGDVSRDATILYLGDLDPSGEDMVRDIKERLSMYLYGGWDIDDAINKRNKGIEDDHMMKSPSGHRVDKHDLRVPLTVDKLALTMDQVRQYNPPPNPAKLSDTRAQGFIDKYGYSSWEVDALPPTVLREIIEDRFEQLIDMDKMNVVKELEQANITRLRAIVGDQADDV